MALAIILVLTVGVVYGLFFLPGYSVWGPVTNRLPTDDKVVALTFDDGPNEPYTSQLLDVLQRLNVKATFFVVSSAAERQPELIKRMLAEGHQVGNHSYSHRFGKYLTQPSFDSEIRLAQQSLQEITGQAPRFFRPPWLFRHPLLLSTAKKQGLVTVGGIFGSGLEILQPSPSNMVKAAVAKAAPGRILIFHDGYNGRGAGRQATVDTIKQLVPKLQKSGFRFVRVDEYLD